MRLLYAFPEPLPLPRARGVQVANAVCSLSAAGVSVALAFVPVEGESPLAPAGMCEACDVHLVPLSRGWPAPLKFLPPFSRWHSVRFFATRLAAVIKAQKPDVLYVRHLKLAVRLLGHSGHVPLVYEAHEVFADTTAPDRRAEVERMEARVIRGANAIVCNSNATADRLVTLYGQPSKLLVLPNAVTPPAQLPEKPWAESQKHVIYAGSFFGWKGVADLVTAARSLDGFNIALIGGDASRLSVPDKFSTAGAQVRVLPRLPQSEVMDMLSASCIAVLPNRPDTDSAFTSPIKLFEYMAAGCAIVAADLPSIREILLPDEAEWFRSGDAASLAQALRRLAADPARARSMGERVKQKSADYTWSVRAGRLKAFLAKTLDDGA